MKENESAMQPPQYPRQEIAAVEKFIQEHDGQFTKPELWSQLSEKIAHQTFDFVIGFLLYRQKIAADELGKIHWILSSKPKNRYSAWEEANAITCFAFRNGFI